MVAAATSFAFAMNAQDSGIETQAIGVVIDAHALVDVVSDEIVFDFSADDPAEAYKVHPSCSVLTRIKVHTSTTV